MLVAGVGVIAVRATRCKVSLTFGPGRVTISAPPVRYDDDIEAFKADRAAHEPSEYSPEGVPGADVPPRLTSQDETYIEELGEAVSHFYYTRREALTAAFTAGVMRGRVEGMRMARDIVAAGSTNHEEKT